jgi:hypothetical protein
LVELSEYEFKKQMQETKSAGNTQRRFSVDISAESFFRPVGFETLCDVVTRNFDDDVKNRTDGALSNCSALFFDIPKRSRSKVEITEHLE